MFELPDHESAQDFFAPHYATFIAAVEQAFRDCDETLNNYALHCIGNPVSLHANQRTPLIHTMVQFQAAKLFGDVEGVEVVMETNGTVELVFDKSIRLRFQKMSDELKFCTTVNSYRERVFRNRSSLGGFLDFSAEALFPVYAGYTLRPSGEFNNIFLMHWDHNVKQWEIDVKRQQGSTDQELPFITQPVVPALAPGLAPLVTPKKREA
jgi:hypothetical protein